MKNIKMYLLIPFIMFVLFGCASNQYSQSKISSVEIVEFGKFDSEEVKRINSENSDMGGVRISKKHILLESSDSFDIELGKSVGIRYSIAGIPLGDKIKVTQRIIYPKNGLKNPKNGKTQKSYQRTRIRKIGRLNYYGYRFEHNWEAVKGEWIFQVLVDDKIMAEKKFNLK